MEDVPATQRDMPPEVPLRPNMVLRRMLFTSNRNLIQSEALLIPVESPAQQLKPAANGVSSGNAKKGAKSSAKKAAKEAKIKAKSVLEYTGERAVALGHLMCTYHRAMVSQIAVMLGARAHAGRCSVFLHCLLLSHRWSCICMLAAGR